MAKKKYKKKPEVFYAVQYDGTNAAEMVAFCPQCTYDDAQDKLYFAGGMITVEPTSWVMYDNAIVFSVMSDEQFKAFFSLDAGGP